MAGPSDEIIPEAGVWRIEAVIVFGQAVAAGVCGGGFLRFEKNLNFMIEVEKFYPNFSRFIAQGSSHSHLEAARSHHSLPIMSMLKTDAPDASPPFGGFAQKNGVFLR
ncbi:MAG: hypothetical protein LBM92_01440 [Opitutaceae bacterium]|nr:hypothetical protein [Opitutaceae bacterium]